MKLMSKETKFELLKFRILHQGYDYDLGLYNLVMRNELDDEISMIDEKTFQFDVPADDGRISANQFLANLNEFTKFMKVYFFNSIHVSFCINAIVESNHSVLKELLKHECPSLNSFFNKEFDPAMEELIIRLIISNFIYNAKYIDSIKEVLQVSKISLKSVDEYSLDESKKILNLLSDISFCQRGRGRLTILFENIDYEIEHSLDIISSYRSKKSNSDDYRNKRIDSYREEYNKILRAYNSKKQYIKYFK